MKIIYHGHACFEVVTENGSVVFDPYADGSVRGLRLPELTADAVICSHSHSDHNAKDKVRLSGKAPGFELTQLSCFHDECRGAKRGENLMTVMEAEGIRLAHCGDLGHELTPAQLRALGRIDVLMIPVGGFFTVDAVTAKSIADKIAPAMVIPMHYRTDGAGLSKIALCDDFTALYPDGCAKYLDSNELVIKAPPAPSVTVFAMP